jgi:glucose-6-phosphate 1-dehydrogenase
MSDAPHSDALVFFGATGDLAYKQIFPALQALVKRGALNMPVVGVARSGWNLDQLRARARDSLEKHGGVDRGAFDKLSSLLHYVDGDYADGSTFDRLRRELGGARRPLHYLAIPPSAFGTVVDGLGRSGCGTNARVALEKPFGRDLESARGLNELLHQVFPEPSVFRIDHYLGKEAVLNLFHFRFANVIPEAVLDRDHVASVQITMAESFGVGGRGKFYEETGTIRDVLQNHLLQIVAIVAMDPPVGHDVEAIRDEKSRLLKAIAPLDAEHVVRGQFRGYRDERGVAKDSRVETFLAVRLAIETRRWAGVPFFVRAGKSLPADAVEVRIDLKPTPHDIFQQTERTCEYFRFRLGPRITQGAIGIHVKEPGESMGLKTVELLASNDQAGDVLPYQRLLGDAMRGDATLFGREDSIETQWRIVEPVLDAQDPPFVYEPGTWGPKEADRLVAGVPGGWHKPINPEKSS